MPAALTLALALLADAPAASAVARPTPQPAERCAAPAKVEPGEIFVCAPKPQGYRIDPDLLEAKRAMRSGRPTRPERLKDKSCASVGPMGCMGGGGIDLIGGAMVAANMVAKAIRGENVGAMFVTDPQRSEYDHYREAKRAREAKEAAAKAKAAKAAAGGQAAHSDPRPSARK